MKCQTQNRVYLPETALAYLIDGDSSGMEAEEVATVDNWLASYMEQFKNVVSYVIALNSDVADMFNKPIFGKAALSFDCSVSVMYN